MRPRVLDGGGRGEWISTSIIGGCQHDRLHATYTCTFNLVYTYYVMNTLWFSLHPQYRSFKLIFSLKSFLFMSFSTSSRGCCAIHHMPL